MIVDQFSEEDTDGSDEEEPTDKAESVLLQPQPQPRSAEKVSLQREPSGRFERKSSKEGKRGQWKRTCTVQAKKPKQAEGYGVQEEGSTLEEASSPQRPSAPASITLQMDNSPEAQSTAVAGEQLTTGEPHARKSMEQNHGNESAGPRRPIVSFIIVKGRVPILTTQRWPEGKLRGKSAHFVFEAVSRIAQRSDFEQINCTLHTSELVHTEMLQKNDEESFTRMEKSFGEEMTKSYKKSRNEGKDLKIYIEPVYLEELTVAGEADDEDGDFVDW